MILPLMKMTISSTLQGQVNLRTQTPDPTPPAASHLHPEDDMDNILDIIGNHQYINDIAGTSIPVQFESRPGEVNIVESTRKILSFLSPFSSKLLSTMLRKMKQPTMMKKYFESYTLYIGRGTLQLFANFEPDPPLTSSRISLVASPELTFTLDEDSDKDSGVGRASPTNPFEDNLDDSDEDEQEPAANLEVHDDQFTVLWYGTDDTNDSSDSDNENGIFPDVPEWNLREINEDLDDISEEEGIFPDIPTEDPAETNENPDDISEEEEEENNIISQIRIANFESLSDDALPGLRITSISSPHHDISEDEEEEDEIISQIRITNFESLSDEDDVLSDVRITSISSLQVREDIKLHCRHFLLVHCIIKVTNISQTLQAMGGGTLHRCLLTIFVKMFYQIDHY